LLPEEEAFPVKMNVMVLKTKMHSIIVSLN
jgi:hypothetical protein